MIPDLRQIRSFIAVAEELHFGRAARRLGISQPPLSKQIQMLEHALGAALFERGKRGVRLTKAGDAALAEAYRLLEQMGRLQQAVADANAAMSRRLTIAYLPSAFFGTLPALLDQFRAEQPSVEIALKECVGIDAIRELQSGTIDLALIRGHELAAPLETLPLRYERCGVVLPSMHRLARLDRIRLIDLAQEIFVMPSRRTLPRYFGVIAEAFEKVGVRPQFVHEAMSIASQIAVVGSGLAVSIVPQAAERSLPAGVSFVPLQEDILIRDLVLVWNGSISAKPRRLFVELARSLIGPG